MKTRSLIKFVAVFTALLLGAVEAIAEDIQNFSAGQTYYYNYGSKNIVLTTNNEEVADTALSVSMYITIYDYYGYSIATFHVTFTNDNSPLDIGVSDSGEGDDGDGIFAHEPTGSEGSVSSGSVDRGVSVTYTPPSGLTAYRVEVQAVMDVQGTHSGTGDIQVY